MAERDAPDDRSGGALEELECEECLALVAALSIGRIAWADQDAAPMVVPVNYAIDRDEVLFRSDPGTKLDAIRNKLVSFQVDFVDPYHRTGWSVLIHGVATVQAPTGVSVDPWPDGAKAHWIRIKSTTITGRRIVLPEIELDSRGYL